MKDIEKWRVLTNKITENWIREYFELSKEDVASGIDYFWVAEDVGGIFEFADYWFDFNTVLKCYELNISKEKLFDWYHYCLENEFVNISLAKFILSPEEKKEQEEKQLAQLKERVELAEKEFKEAMERYDKSR